MNQVAEMRATSGTALRGDLLAHAPVTERRIDVAGVSTAIIEGGDGPPMVLLHGQGAWAGVWMSVIPRLTTTHHVIAPDLPGLGASDVGGTMPTPDLVLEWLGELIDQTCDEPPVLVGMSLGGSIAARFAARHSDRIRHLVLVDAGGLSGPVRLPPNILFTLIRHGSRPSERTASRFMRYISADVDNVRRRMGPKWPPFQAYLLDRSRDEAVKRANRTLLRKLGIPAIPAEDLATITTPTTLIWGRLDRIMPVKKAEAARDRFGWPLYVIEDAGHIVHVDQPEAFVRTLRNALKADR